ncbi:hypothetical protein [Lysinibacillus mangiferihumi]|nr:hypothetical protein [Lysinibacillus mangiferihumi]
MDKTLYQLAIESKKNEAIEKVLKIFTPKIKKHYFRQIHKIEKI